MRIPGRIAALVVSAVVLSSCGIAFGSAQKGNDFFKSIDVSGEMRTGETLTLAFSYGQKHPLAVPIKCELRQNKELVKDLGVTEAPEVPYGNPEATPLPGNYTFDFTVDAAGTYKVQCYTTQDEDNFIEEEITVEQGTSETPTPVRPEEL